MTLKLMLESAQADHAKQKEKTKKGRHPVSSTHAKAVGTKMWEKVLDRCDERVKEYKSRLTALEQQAKLARAAARAEAKAKKEAAK